MKQKILGFLAAVVVASVGLSVAGPTSVEAADNTKSCGTPGFLGLRPWYYGLCEGGEGTEIKEPSGEDEIAVFVWKIVLNVLIDLLVIVGYASMIFIIYGGYQFIMSQGDPGKVASGKKTLTSAIIGMVISLSASVIVNTGMVILNINTAGGSLDKCTGSDCNDRLGANFTQEQVQNAFTWAYTVAGLVAVAFIIYGGVKYVISQGDPGKARSAMQTIIYAVAGLIVVLMAAAITALVISSTTTN